MNLSPNLIKWIINIVFYAFMIGSTYTYVTMSINDLRSDVETIKEQKIDGRLIKIETQLTYMNKSLDNIEKMLGALGE